MTIVARITKISNDADIAHVNVQSCNVCGIIVLDVGGDETFTTLIPWHRVLDLNSDVDGEIQFALNNK